MRLRDLPWRDYGVPGSTTTHYAEVACKNGKKISVWRPGCWGTDIELHWWGEARHRHLSYLEARVMLIELGAKPLPPKTTRSSTT